jgi:uncharacterized PurR-regulated membrane protein YhhQ (DUF165 family)
VAISSLASAPLDTVAFLALAFGADSLSPLAVALTTAAKLSSALAAAAILRGPRPRDPLPRNADHAA